MKFLYDIPASFWGLFRSVNREIYMEALLTIDDEYQYNNFFLSREACVQILGEMCAQQKLLKMCIRDRTKTDRQQECICTDKCGKQGNESCPLCSLWPERCRAKGFQNTQLCLIILGISVFLGVFVLELLVYILSLIHILSI